MAGSLNIAAALADSRPLLFDFLFDLVIDPNCNGVPGASCLWCGHDAFCFDRDELDSFALEWASDEDLPWPDRVALLLSLDQLPWQDERVTFYWSDFTE